MEYFKNLIARIRSLKLLSGPVLLAITVVAGLALEFFFGVPSGIQSFPSLPAAWPFIVFALGCALLGIGWKRTTGRILVGLVAIAPIFQPVLVPASTLVLAIVAGTVVARRGEATRRFSIAWALTAFVTIGGAYVGLFVALPYLTIVSVGFWAHANVALAVIAAICATIYLVSRNATNVEADGKLRNVGGWIAVVCAWLLVPLFGVFNQSEAVMTLQLRNSMRVTTIELPQTIQDRLLPQPTAQTYVQNLNATNNTSTDKPHLQLQPGGQLYWQAGVQDGDRLGRVFQSVANVITVDADHTEQNGGPAKDSDFVYSDKSWVFKAAFAARHPFSQVAFVNYYRHTDGSWSILASYTSKRPSWNLPAIGTMIPYFSGVMEVTQVGWVRDWTVREAASRFPGVVLNPPTLVRLQAEAYGHWHGGLSGAKILQDDVLEISEDKNEDSEINALPYVQHFDGLGLQLTVPYEPKGDNQFAFVEMLMADAGTGEFRRVIPPKGLIGPRQARLQVRSSDTRIDWSRVRKVEPRLVVAPRGIFWCVAIVSDWDGEVARYPYLTSVLVDARKTTECYTLETAKDVNDFLSQSPPAPKQ